MYEAKPVLPEGDFPKLPDEFIQPGKYQPRIDNGRRFA